MQRGLLMTHTISVHRNRAKYRAIAITDEGNPLNVLTNMLQEPQIRSAMQLMALAALAPAIKQISEIPTYWQENPHSLWCAWDAVSKSVDQTKLKEKFAEFTLFNNYASQRDDNSHCEMPKDLIQQFLPKDIHKSIDGAVTNVKAMWNDGDVPTNIITDVLGDTTINQNMDALVNTVLKYPGMVNVNRNFIDPILDTSTETTRDEVTSALLRKAQTDKVLNTIMTVLDKTEPSVGIRKKILSYFLNERNIYYNRRFLVMIMKNYIMFKTNFGYGPFRAVNFKMFIVGLYFLVGFTFAGSISAIALTIAKRVIVRLKADKPIEFDSFAFIRFRTDGKVLVAATDFPQTCTEVIYLGEDNETVFIKEYMKGMKEDVPLLPQKPITDANLPDGPYEIGKIYQTGSDIKLTKRHTVAVSRGETKHCFLPVNMVEYAVGDKDFCAICIENITYDTSAEPFCQLQCGHLFHCRCINQWLNQNKMRKCVLCNEPGQVSKTGIIFPSL